MTGQSDTPATGSIMQQDSSWADRACRLLLIPFWFDAYYIFLITSHIILLSSSCHFPHQQIMVTEAPQQGDSGSESSELTDPSSNVSVTATQQQSRHQLVHLNTANAGSGNMTQYGHIKMGYTMRSCKNRKQHVIRCEYIHIEVDSHQLTVQYTAGFRGELCNQLRAARNGKSLWSIMACDHTVCEMNYYDIVSTRNFADNICDTRHWEWMKQLLNTLEKATEAYMVEVIAESHFRCN